MAMPTRRAARLYAKELGLALVAYSIVVQAAIRLIDHDPHAPWRWVAVLAPMVPAAFAARAVVRGLRRMDELQRRIQLEALAFAFAIGSFLTMSIGFLQLVGLPTLSWVFAWPILAVLWAVGAAWAQHRYAGPER